jgi:CRP-like cAMP-binding protein
MKILNDEAALRSCFLFSSLSDKTIQALSKACLSTTYAGGALIFAMGDEADGLRIILEGSVRVWISDSDGRELTVAMLEPGDSFGEIALFDGLPRSATASALEDTRCLFLPQTVVDRLLSENVGFANEVIKILCEILRRNTDEMGSITFRSLDSRLALKLCDLSVAHAIIDGNSARFTRKFSQGDLAKILGVTREAINKRLTVFSRENLIEMHDGFIVIPAIDLLASRHK